MLKGRGKERRLVDGTTDVVDWLPVFEFICPSNGRVHAYGINCDAGTWNGEYLDRQRITRSDAFVAFYVLLEKSFRDIAAMVAQEIQRVGLPPVVRTTFPFDAIVVDALTNGSNWGLLASCWLDEGYPANDRIACLAPGTRSVKAWHRARHDAIFAPSQVDAEWHQCIPGAAATVATIGQEQTINLALQTRTTLSTCRAWRQPPWHRTLRATSYPPESKCLEEWRLPG